MIPAVYKACFLYFQVIKGIAQVAMTLAFTSSNHMKPVAFER